MNYIKKTTTALLVLITIQVSSQDILTKKEALEIALENNYGVKIANNNVEVAKNNSSIYNSGYLPTVSATAGANYNNNNQTTELQEEAVQPNQDNPIENDGVITKSYNASIGLNYTIFDGLGRKYNYKQLVETYNLTELQARETIENMYLQLFTVYFQIARFSENTNNLKEALEISKQRLKRAEYQYEYGQTTKLELLNAEVDVNNDSINYINSRQQFYNTKRNLNIILGTQKGVGYEVETEVVFKTLMSFDELMDNAMQNNALLNQTDKNIAISELNEKISKSNYFPAISLSTSYGWNKSENENPTTVFQSLSNATTGLNAGINLSWNLFDGGSTKTNVANAKIALENQQILKEQQLETLKNNLNNIYDSYQNAMFVLQAQEKNVITNQNNFDRTQERYKLGQVTSIEFRQAQINLLNSQTAYSNAKYDAKLLELELLQLSGDILNVDF